MIYLYYKLGQLEAQARAKYNLFPKDNGILYLILAIFGFSIIADALVQDDLNKELGSAVNAAHNPTYDPTNFNNHNQ